MAKKPSTPRTPVRRFERAGALIWLAGSLSFPRTAWAEDSEDDVVDVYVSAERPALGHARRAPSVASTVLEGSELRGAGESTADILEQVPGVQVTRTGAQSDLATASIRGADAKQVPVYLAGIRLNDDVTGTADLSTVPLRMLHRVEVFRGNAPIEADRLGIGGAIFLWPRIPYQPHGGGGVEVGSFGQRGAWVEGAVGNAEAGTLVAVRRARADNDYPFINDHGQRFDRDEERERRVNADYAETDAWSVSRYELGDGARVHTVLSALDREQGITGLSILPAEHARSRTRRLLAGISSRVPCSRSGACRLEMAASFIAATNALYDPLAELRTTRSRWLHNQGFRFSQDVRLVYDLDSDWQLSLGSHLADGVTHITRVANLPRAGQRKTLTPRAGVRFRATDAITLHGLSSLECHATEGTIERFQRNVHTDSGACGVLEPAGRIGAQWQIAERTELLANVGRYVRVPTLAELFGTSPLVNGNPQLRPETGVTLDAGVRWTEATSDESTFSLDAFGFWREARDLVRFRQTSLQAVEPFNVARARLLGLELASAWEAFQHLRARVAGTLLDPRETSRSALGDAGANDVLPLTARLTVSSWFEVYSRIERLGPLLERAALGIRYQHKSSRFDDPAGQTVLPEQNLVDVELSTSHWHEQWALRLAVKNLFDSSTMDLVGLPVPGRSYHASLEAWF